jgi:hypothetical protein
VGIGITMRSASVKLIDSIENLEFENSDFDLLNLKPFIATFLYADELHTNRKILV